MAIDIRTRFDAALKGSTDTTHNFTCIFILSILYI